MSIRTTRSRSRRAMLAVLATAACSIATLIVGPVAASANSTVTSGVESRTDGPVMLIIDDWNESQKESNSDMRCADGKVMVGRSHWGDENARSWIRCAGVIVNGDITATSGEFWTPNRSESSGAVACPSNMVITGRRHSGDENGLTSYRCATLTIETGQLKLDAAAFSGDMRESSHEYVCSGVGILSARAHWGDENGTTRYRCSTIRA